MGLGGGLQIRKTRFIKRGAPNGFGVIETLVSVTIVMIVLAGIGSVLTQQTREINRYTQKYEVAEIKNNLHSALTDSLACKNILKEVTVPLKAGDIISLPQISIPKYNLDLKKTSMPSQPIPGSSSGLKLKSLALHIDKLMSNTTNQYLGYFEVQLESSLQNFIPIKIRKIIRIDSLGKAEGCIAELVLSCAPGEFYSAMDSAGLPICISLQCPAGKVAQGVSSAGLVMCVDDTGITQKSLSCAANEFLSGVSSSGNAICLSIPVPTSPTAKAQIPPPSVECSLDFIADQGGDGWSFPSAISKGSSSVLGSKTQGGCIPSTSVCVGTTLTFVIDLIQGQRYFFVANDIKGVQGRSGEVVYRCP